MTELAWILAMLQAERPQATTNAIQTMVFTGLFLVIAIVAMVYIFKKLRPKNDQSSAALVQDEFEKSRDALLLAAQARKQSRESAGEKERELDAEEKERQLLLEGIDMDSVFGQDCPLSRMPMEPENDLIVDPYSGRAYHFSSFLNDWPVDTERPKYIYRYPEGVIVKSEDLIRGF